MTEQIEKTIAALRRNQFAVEYFDRAEEARNYILSCIKVNATVGMPGSMTIRSLGLEQGLAEKNATVFNHHMAGITQEEKIDIMRKQLTSDVLLTSANAVTENGELLSVDGAGNRLAAMMFGPKKVLVVVGKNKIVPDMDAAMERLRTEVCPRNNRRLKTGNPCVTLDHCVDCHKDERICRIYSVIARKPIATDLTVVLVDEVLGY